MMDFQGNNVIRLSRSRRRSLWECGLPGPTVAANREPNGDFPPGGGAEWGSVSTLAFVNARAAPSQCPVRHTSHGNAWAQTVFRNRPIDLNKLKFDSFMRDNSVLVAARVAAVRQVAKIVTPWDAPHAELKYIVGATLRLETSSLLYIEYKAFIRSMPLISTLLGTVSMLEPFIYLEDISGAHETHVDVEGGRTSSSFSSGGFELIKKPLRSIDSAFPKYLRGDH